MTAPVPRFLVLARFLMACGLITLAICACEKKPAAPVSPPKQTLSVAAASDLRYALDEILAAFSTEHPEVQATATYGSSGNLSTQISEGAPFDLFLSADIAYPDKLVEQGRAMADSRFKYGVGRLVVWAGPTSGLNPGDLHEKTLTAPGVVKIAIANPAHAPYGRAAEAAIKSWGLSDAVRERLVLGDNVTQAAQFVESGNAQVGIIALSLALSPPMKDKGRSWLVPAADHPALQQGGVITMRAKDSVAARALRDFITGQRGQEILARYGFER